MSFAQNLLIKVIGAVKAVHSGSAGVKPALRLRHAMVLI
jgi:hypothetical protein